jgi:hypothetical protein
MSSKRSIIDESAIKTFFQGFLGATTFGAYNQYFTNKNIEILTGQIAEQKELIKKMNQQIEERDKAMRLLEERSWWKN